MSDIYYKIRSKTTGLFSTGGSDVTWNKVGKVWRRKGDLSSHFTGLTSHGRKQYRDNDAEVVELETVVHNLIPVEQYLEQADERRVEKTNEAHRRRADKTRKDELAVLKHLQKKYPGGV